MTDTTYAFGTTSALRSGAWHAPVLAEFPGLAEQFLAGTIDAGAVEIELHPDSDDGVRWLAAQGQLDGVAVTVESVLTQTDANGVATETVRTRTLTCTGASLSDGRVRLTLADVEVDRLNATWPTLTWDTASFAGVRAEDAGRTIAHPVGTVRKLSGILLTASAGDYRYGVATGEALPAITASDIGLKTYTIGGDWTDRISAGQVVTAVSTLSRLRHVVVSAALSGSDTVVTVAEGINAAASNLSLLPAVLAVYRNGRLVSASEYAVHHVQVSTGPATGISYTELRFTAEQRDFSGNLFAITADVRGTVSRNAVTHIGLMLGRAGVAVDASSLASAEAYADSERMLIDADLGRDGPRRIRAIIEDLAFVARAALRRTDTGAYAIVQDRPATLGTALDESAGDLVTAGTLARERRPASIGIRYRPSPQDPDRLQHEIRRAVIGTGVGDEAARDVPYLADHDAADRLLSYLARRAEHNATLQLREHVTVRDLGERISVRSPAAFPGTREFSVWELTTRATGADLVLREYNDAVHTYVPGTLPPDAVVGFEPDYSQTPPAAPTGLAQSLAATSTGADGQTVARLTASAVPPAVNAAETWFAAVHTATGAITLGQGASSGGGVYSAVLGDLRPGEAYQVLAWAVNAWGLKGAAAAINVTASGTAGAPAAPTSMLTSNAGAVANGGGDAVAFITVSAIPPSINAATNWFAAVRATTGETTILQASGIVSGRVSATFTGLRPGESYTLRAWAVNANGLRGSEASIGITATAYAALMPVPTFVSISGSVGDFLVPIWNAIASAEVVNFIIFRRTQFSGDGSTIEAKHAVGRVSGTQFTDKLGGPGAVSNRIYTYWLRTVNRWGTESVDSAPISINTGVV